VLVQGNVGFKGSDGEGISGVVVNEGTVQNMTISVENQFGEVVKTINAGTQTAGNIEFEWDGRDQQGNLMPAGEYVISATGELNGEGVQMNTAVNRHVGSVSLAGSGQGVILNLDGDVSINLDDVIQIGS
jgi:flagellar basal-body rod modification protein FlgD